MASDWFTVFDDLSIAPSDWTGESQLSRDHFWGKVALTNKMRDNVDLVSFNHPQHFAEAGFFFSEPANHVNKDPLL
jgi:hypothetical protein